MIIKLNRWITEITDEEDNFLNPPILPKGYYVESVIRLDRIDKYSLEDDEIVLTISGTEFFFDYDEIEFKKIERYFEFLNTNEN